MKEILAKSLCIFLALTASVTASEYTDKQLAMQYLLVSEGLISSPKEINSRLAYHIDKHRDWHAIRRLLEAGADPNGIDNDTSKAVKAPHLQSYIYKCVKDCEDVRIMYMLIEAGANIHVQLPNHLTLMHHLAVDFDEFKKMNPTQWQDFFNLLINKGLNINQQTKEGITALMIAAKNGQLELVQYLIGKGADTALRLNKGQRAIDLVPENHHHSDAIRQILESAEPVL